MLTHADTTVESASTSAVAGTFSTFLGVSLARAQDSERVNERGPVALVSTDAKSNPKKLRSWIDCMYSILARGRKAGLRFVIVTFQLHKWLCFELWRHGLDI